MQVQKQIVKSAGRAFSTQSTLVGSMVPERNHALRVMSTPTWPVPYYQRLYRHPTNTGDMDKGDLAYIAQPIDDVHVIIAKEQLRATGLGYVVEAVENHADTDTYCTSFADSTMFSKAYTEDLLDCLGVAFEQHSRAFKEVDLADALK